MRDDIETNVKFIELVRLNPCLYDQTRPDYSNRNVQDKAWGEIAQQMKETVTICRERWKNIRGRYVKQMNKPPSGSAATQKKPYYLAEYLNFLDMFIRSRTPVGNIQPQSTETDEVLSTDIAAEEQSTTDTILHSDTSTRSTPEPSAGSSSQSNYYRRKNKQTVSLNEVNRSAIDYFEERKKRQMSAPLVQDPDEAFLKSVLPDMKNMTDSQKRNFKVAVLQIAGEILNQPVVTPRSSSSLHNMSSPSTSTMALESSSQNAILERTEQTKTQNWNKEILLPQYSVITQATDCPAPNLNENIEEFCQFSDHFPKY